MLSKFKNTPIKNPKFPISKVFQCIIYCCLLNISSTLSTNDNCCDNIAEYEAIYEILVRLFEKYPGNEEIIVRLTYTAGNMVARNDDARVKVN